VDTSRICFVLFNLKILYCYVNTIVREVETSHMLSVIASIALEEKEQLFSRRDTIEWYLRWDNIFDSFCQAACAHNRIQILSTHHGIPA